MDAHSRDTIFEARLKRDLAVLTTLAQLGCATFPQLQALCFPHCVASTAWVALANLTAAGYLALSRWYLKQATREQGRVWTITRRGTDAVTRYVTSSTVFPAIDLGCPSTALEYATWRTRIQVQTLIVALILEARRAAFLASLRVTPMTTWPTAFQAAYRPDAVLHICWNAPTTMPSDWLPWCSDSLHSGPEVQYLVYLDHVMVVPPLCWSETSAPAERYCQVVCQAREG